MSDQREETRTPPPRNSAIIGERFCVDFSNPLPGYDTAGALAYGASDTEEASHGVYALACRPGVPIRQHLLETQKIQSYSNLLCVEASGLLPRVDGGGLGQVLIVRRPEGGALEWNPDDTTARISETTVRKILLPQVLDGLESLFSHDQTHRRINPRSLFYDDGNKTLITLGECVSEPPGASQPVMFEPIERALASPNGRGEGRPADDMYALGVTLYCLLRGGNPLKNQSDSQNIQARLTRGTWSALGEDEGIPRGFVTLLCGLLNDDPEARWTLREVRLWLDGTAPRARTGRKTTRAPITPIEYGGAQILDSRFLAYLLTQRPAQGVRRIRAKDFVTWVTDGLRDAPDKKKLQNAIDRAGKSGKNRVAADLFLLARVCRLLDPAGPIRLGQLAFFIDGLGPMLAAAFKTDKKNDLQILEAGIGSGLLLDAVDQGKVVNTRRQRLDAIKVQDNVHKNSLGRGLERSLYDLCPSLPCQSPIIEPDHVANLSYFAIALEAAAAKGRLTPGFIDRHMAAFLGRQSAALAPQIELLRAAGGLPSALALATLDLLETVQRRFAPRPLPALVAWMCGELDRVIELLHNKKRRDLMAEKLASVSSGANLTEVVRTMDFPSVLKRDEVEYQHKVIEFAGNELQLRKYRRRISRRDRTARATGYGGVAVVGAVVWALVLGFFVFGGRG